MPLPEREAEPRTSAPQRKKRKRSERSKMRGCKDPFLSPNHTQNPRRV